MHMCSMEIQRTLAWQKEIKAHPFTHIWQPLSLLPNTTPFINVTANWEKYHPPGSSEHRSLPCLRMHCIFAASAGVRPQTCGHPVSACPHRVMGWLWSHGTAWAARETQPQLQHTTPSCSMCEIWHLAARATGQSEKIKFSLSRVRRGRYGTFFMQEAQQRHLK